MARTKRKAAKEADEKRKTKPRLDVPPDSSQFATPFFNATSHNQATSAVSQVAQNSGTKKSRREERTIDISSTEAQPDAKTVVTPLYGPYLPVKSPATQAADIVDTIILNLRKRDADYGLIVEGRTEGMKRLYYDLYDGGLRENLISRICDYKGSGDQTKNRIRRALNNALHYLICWNTDAFPELTGVEDGEETFLPQYPGSYTSMFAILAADGMDLRDVDFSRPAACASLIYNALVDRVTAAVPDSRLLYGLATPLDMEIVQSLRKSSKDATAKASSRTRIKRVLKKLRNLQPVYLTLAFVLDNFQTALTRTIRIANFINDNDPVKVGATVEALMYRLALKDSKAFPEVFSLAQSIENAENYPRSDHQSEEEEDDVSSV